MPLTRINLLDSRPRSVEHLPACGLLVIYIMVSYPPLFYHGLNMINQI